MQQPLRQQPLTEATTPVIKRINIRAAQASSAGLCQMLQLYIVTAHETASEFGCRYGTPDSAAYDSGKVVLRQNVRRRSYEERQKDNGGKKEELNVEDYLGV